MHKIIIVEDDRIIRKSLMNAPWEKHGFMLVGEATNGEDAIQLIEIEQPQVVISDIKMPFMDGLEMAKVVKQKSPLTKVIFLTGYEDFNYAQEAVKLQAYDFILKPVSTVELIDKAKRAAEEWEVEKRKEENYRASLPLLQQNFFQELENRGTEYVDVEKELANLGVYLSGPYYAVMLIQITLQQIYEEEKERLIDYLICQIPELFDLQNNHLMQANPNEFVLLLSLEKDDQNKKLELGQQILNKIGHHMTITIGRTYDNLFDIGTSYIETRMAMGLKHIMGTGKVYSIDEVVLPTSHHKRILDELDERLEHEIKLGLPTKVFETLQKIELEIINHKSMSLEETRLLMIRYSTLLVYEIKKWQLEYQVGENTLSLYDTIMQMESLDEMMTTLEALVHQWLEVIAKAKDPKRNTLVEQAIDYLRENYHDTELTQQRVAEEIFVTAPYLSNLFKSEKGMNFNDYLVEIRMNKAMELLRNSDLKTYEIAQRVGYNHSQYFSSSFKKFTGCTPGEFRDKYVGK